MESRVEPGERERRRWRAGWLRYWEFMRRWHRFEVIGLEHILDGPPSMLVGYHARGFAADACMLSVELYRRTGRLPRAVFHKGIDELPIVPRLLHSIDGVTSEDDSLKAAIDGGDHIVVMPGGAREGLRSSCSRYEVDWGDHTGYLTLAAKLGIPIIPFASSGVDDLHIALNNGDEWAKWIGTPGDFPVWAAFGMIGMWPFSLPFPVKVTQLIGEPIALRPTKKMSEKARKKTHEEVQAHVQRLLDQVRLCG